jgi:PTH1 family peptidyl-tRNA hydrolase
MNLSGQTVRVLTAYYQVPQNQLLVLVDDADLPLGTLRLRPQGGSGGHHGLESIQQHLGTQQYARLRLGIGRRATDGRQITNYVLGRFQPAEAELLEKTLDQAAEQVECWLTAGIERAMNIFNRTVETEETKET